MTQPALDIDTLSGRNRIAFLILFSLILLIYSNTFDASWHLDDYPNITRDSRMHLTDLRPGSILATFVDISPNGADIYRPLARLSFALNWYWGQDRVFGYHAVNIGIHFFTAGLLYLCLLNLFLSPRLRLFTRAQDVQFISLLATVLWAVNPIQTQAVTYIVQRMAIMATLFFVSALYCYLIARNSKSMRRRVTAGAGTVVSFLLALSCKENAITLPIALLLTEMIFYQDFGDPAVKNKLIKGSIAAGFLVIVCGLFFANLWKENPLSYLESLYGRRDFSLWERILTQPRVVVFYLGQIFYPIPSRLSIVHDFAVSRSVWEPWTTLPSIFFVIGLIGSAFKLVKRFPLIAYGVLFFFLNHLVESTVLPLEMVFEHRNYLPSLFLFLPVAGGLRSALSYYHSRKTEMYWVLAAFVALLVLGQGIGTYVRNMAWKTEKSLWEDAIAKAPEKARPYINLAYGHYQRTGQFEAAIAYYRLGLAREPSSTRIKYTVFNNMGNIYFAVGDYEAAARMFALALENDPGSIKAAVRRLQSLLQSGKWKQAQAVLENLDPDMQSLFPFLNFKGYLLLRQGSAQEAIACLRGSLKAKPNQTETLLHLGVALQSVGMWRQGAWFLRLAAAADKNSPLPLFHLISAGVHQGDQTGVKELLSRLFGSFSIAAIQSGLKRFNSDPEGPGGLSVVPSVVAAEIERMATAVAGGSR